MSEPRAQADAAAAPPSLAPGLRLGPYEILASLGAGGMGEVYRARDTRLDREVAIKVLPAHVANNPQRLRRFEQEARIVAALSHPNVLALFDVGTHEGSPFLVTELLDGQTLADVLLSGPLPVARATDISVQVARGLGAAHARHVIHRDLKPSNVFLTHDGQVKILDFGIAKLTQIDAPPAEPAGDVTPVSASLTGTATGDVGGTFGYMAPEQVHGQPCDVRTDIFAFGCVVYEMLTGRRAFPGTTASGTLRVVADDPPPLRSVRAIVPASLEHLVGRCLEKRPDDRFASTHDLALALEATSEGRTHDGALRRRRAAMTVASVFIVAGLVGALAWLGGGRQREAANIGQPHARNAVAVLPLRNLSPDPAYAYFAGGLHDELLTQLSKVASLQVISRTSVMGYHDTTKPIAQIALELQVGSVVEGTVQVTGGRLRVTVQLLDAATDRHVWAERYDRTLDDAFAVQSDVAQRIAAAVGVALSPDELNRLATAPTANPEAYRDYLQGRVYQTRPGYVESNLRAAQLLFERAVEREPAFALAHAALADVHQRMAWFRYDTSAERLARIRDEADTALRLAPTLPQAHAAKALVHYSAGDYRLSIGEIDTALETQPGNAELLGYKGYAHRRLGTLDDALAAFASASRLNPRDADLFWDLGGETLGLAHRYQEAIEAYDHALVLAPDLHVVAVLRAWMFARWRGDLGPVRTLLDSLPPDADLTIWSTVAGHRAQLRLFERDATRLLAMPELHDGTDFTAQVYFVPAALYAAWAHQLRGDNAAARAAFESARARLDAAVVEMPGDWRVHASRGMALAGLGLRHEAMAEAEWLKGSVVYNRDAHFGSMAAESRARILAQAGDPRAALDEIDRLLARPSWLSVHMLRLDPRWDPLRAEPRFVALLASAEHSAQTDAQAVRHPR